MIVKIIERATSACAICGNL